MNIDNVVTLNSIATAVGAPANATRFIDALNNIAGELIGLPQAFRSNIDALNAIAGNYIGQPQNFKSNIDALNAIVNDLGGQPSTYISDALVAWQALANVAPIASLEFHVQPGDAVAGSPFGTQPVVRALDGMGAVVTSFTGNVTISIASGAGTLSGTLTIPAVAGVATFTDLSIDTPGDFSLGASGDSFTVESDSFTVAPNVDADAQAYFDAIVSAGSTISTDQQVAINTFVLAAKAHGYWGNLLDCSPLAGANLTAARVKLKRFGSSPTSLTNSGFAGGFVNGDYTPTTGIQGGAGKFLATGVNMQDLAATGGLSFFLPERDFAPDGGTLQQMIGCSFGAPYCSLSFVGTTMYTGWGPLQTWTTCPATAPPFGMGLYRISSDTTTSHNLLVGDAAVHTSGAENTDTKDSLITVFAKPDDDWHWTQTGAWYSIDDGGITGSKATNFHQDMLVLQAALGRIPALITQRHNYFPVIGQSLARGGNGGGVLTTEPNPSNRNRMQTFTSDAFLTGFKMGNLVLLAGYSDEHPGLGFASLLSSIAGSHDNDVTVDNWGLSGSGIQARWKGTDNYADVLGSIQRAFDLTPYYFSGGIWVPAMMLVDEEADYQSPTRQADLVQYQSDYQTDIRAITGQVEIVPFLFSQMSSWTSLGSSTTALAPYADIAAWKAAPTKFIPVCAKYFLTHVDGLHLTKESYRWLGEYYAKAYKKVIVDGGTWNPLYPTTIGRTGAVITLSFANRVGNLVLDDTAIVDPGNFGFEFFDDGGPSVTISSVTIVSNQVIVTLSGTPSGSGKRVRYAYTGVLDAGGGPTTGPRGCLRDSDTTITSLYGNNLSNWCLHFDEPC